MAEEEMENRNTGSGGTTGSESGPNTGAGGTTGTEDVGAAGDDAGERRDERDGGS